MRNENTKSHMLPDIRDIYIDTTQPTEKRLSSFIDAVGDPYHFRVGETEVELRFDDSASSLYSCLVKLGKRI
ncbi:DUF6870 family protein [Agathobaculum sp. Marseille-P7918]|uniref:DUF6870 family protein n=1 Tax=Agathobaculum sp. Marseille-P7918 TaxID=2479843 RepID=UPI0035676093